MSIKLISIIAVICLLVSNLITGTLTYKVTDGNWQTKYDNHLLEDSAKRDNYLSKIRTLETDLTAEQNKVEQNAKIMQEKYVADLLAANDTAERLRTKIRDLSAARNGKNTRVNREWTAAETDSLVYLQLFERADRVAGELAEYADRSRKAGLICENKYNAVYNSLYHF